MQDRKHPNRTVNILGVRVGTITVQDLIEFIIGSVENGERVTLAYINIHAVNLAQKQRWFRDYLNHATQTFCDGFGVVFGARILGYRIPQRGTPPDWLPELAGICAQKGYRLCFLGARPGIAERAAVKLIQQHPTLITIPAHDGFFDKTYGSTGNKNVVEWINAQKADILVVGLGMPTQERWLSENWSNLNCLVALPVGAAFDYLSGAVPRAPHWMTDHGLEWLGRLLVEPKRLGSRYLLGIPTFFLNIFKQKLGLIAFES